MTRRNFRRVDRAIKAAPGPGHPWRRQVAGRDSEPVTYASGTGALSAPVKVLDAELRAFIDAAVGARKARLS